MKVAIIPARGGSKRIPRKNVKPFCGKPMINWSIEAAQQSECFDLIIVSTDDAEIARLAEESGAAAPFIRPPSLADDLAATSSVIAHAIEWLNNNVSGVDLACCIYATAPFIAAEDIRRGLQILIESKSEYAFSVTSYAFPIQRAIRINNERRIEMLNPEYFNTRSQDLEEVWHDAGQFYWGRARSWLTETPIFSNVSTPIAIPRHRVQDIDTREDWVRAEYMFKAMQMDRS
ncbi:pseudaminic acid cytidylyltransferase [Pusillimonas sp.]|uniref:pseudaminic acid cytidylyltransferase n=1 Tax=Pusillimonas sp. TaxID=3040095 RepID=UPI0029B199A8|nr:pseudaminic acid cytidylyltransferase [Pusillimonas sp.]MDX3895326.1 pseudaminic acid cytidylyltransferase [Pusillimonas sp.]